MVTLKDFIFGNFLYSMINSITGELAAQELSFEWPHFKISSKNLKVSITLDSTVNSTTGKYCSVAFIQMAAL